MRRVACGCDGVSNTHYHKHEFCKRSAALLLACRDVAHIHHAVQESGLTHNPLLKGAAHSDFEEVSHQRSAAIPFGSVALHPACEWHDVCEGRSRGALTNQTRRIVMNEPDAFLVDRST